MESWSEEMREPLQAFSSPVVAAIVRAAFGAYVIYMSRRFYAYPMGYFRKSAPDLTNIPWFRGVVRGLACFCLWGGCFIVATAIAVQILDLHSGDLASVLILAAACATFFLLPKDGSGS
jgi:hypothetical protein